MNKRICELKEAAMEVTFSSPSTGREQKQLNVDKFAELIVRECADFAIKRAENQTDLGIKTILTLTGYQIKEHFGVEQSAH